jgi:hypothetical protein
MVGRSNVQIAKDKNTANRTVMGMVNPRVIMVIPLFSMGFASIGFASMGFARH